MYAVKVREAFSNNRINLFISVVSDQWAVLQYVVVRPRTYAYLLSKISCTDLLTIIVISIIGIICQALNILCESQGFNPHFANVYLEAIDFVTIRWVRMYFWLLSTLYTCCQFSTIWAPPLLWLDTRGVEREKTTGKIFVNKAYCLLHILSIFHCKQTGWKYLWTVLTPWTVRCIGGKSNKRWTICEFD